MAITPEQARAELARREIARRAALNGGQPQGPSMGQKIAQVASTPFRGYRGAAVGLENLLAGKGLQPSLNRAAEGVQPGFQPKGLPESIASAVGESGPLMPLGGVMGAGLRGAGISALASGGTSALMQKSERGSVSPTETGVATALGGAVPLSFQAVKAAYPKIAGLFTKTAPEAFERAMDDPQFLTKYTGSIEAIRNRANKVVEAFQGVRGKLGTALENFKTFKNLRPTSDEIAEELAATGGQPRTLDRVASELKEIQGKSAPTYTEKAASKLVDANGKPIMKTVVKPGLTERQKLMKLVKLDQDLNATTGGSYDDYSFGLKREIRDAINKVPGGRTYQKLRSRWSDFKDVEEELGKTMADPDKAPIVLEKLMRGDIKGALTGSFGKVSAAVRHLETMGDIKEIMKPLRSEILAGMLRGHVSEFSPKGVIGKALLLKYPLVGATEMAMSSPKLLAKLTPFVRGAAKNSGKIATQVPSALRALAARREE